MEEREGERWRPFRRRQGSGEGATGLDWSLGVGVASKTSGESVRRVWRGRQ